MFTVMGHRHSMEVYFWCCKRMKGSHLIVTNHSGRERDGDAVISRKASRLIELQEKKSYQQILMVFLVNSRHNESAVPPPEFLLSTPTLNIKISRISSLFSSLCRFLSTLCEDPRDTLSSFLSSLAVSSHVSLMITVLLV